MSSDRNYARAFVLQFDARSDVAAGRFAGRVEHVASMRSARFVTLDDLLSFISMTLTEVGRTRPASDGTD